MYNIGFPESSELADSVYLRLWNFVKKRLPFFGSDYCVEIYVRDKFATNPIQCFICARLVTTSVDQ
ncbi:hypothetical protein C485_13535 [Natrinema altunense JCM 12890]|uniref:Uncharacterized protein n=1 Tax=Natrinema altunense (strain JCM 12890 / CGMCC 1.3731 / AJ2) TaxID=1227494 RepID=L9ZFA4_NATA2|nr:hypothetical protein C485_13535 [Natrinema altunense JCM 12890]